MEVSKKVLKVFVTSWDYSCILALAKCLSSKSTFRMMCNKGIIFNFILPCNWRHNCRVRCWNKAVIIRAICIFYVCFSQGSANSQLNTMLFPSPSFTHKYHYFSPTYLWLPVLLSHYGLTVSILYRNLSNALWISYQQD